MSSSHCAREASRPRPGPQRVTAAIVGLVALLGTAGYRTDSASDPANTDWELLGNSTDMQHHSALSTINKDNVGQLELAWAVEMPTPDGLSGNPLIKNGIVFQSGSLGQMFANDLKTGKLLWAYQPQRTFEAGDGFARTWGARTNRGLALWRDLAITSAGDCTLEAVDQKTGKLRWKSTSCDGGRNINNITSAPRVGGDLIFTGSSCADYGNDRGFVDALDAATGKRRWRFYTVPGDPAKPQDDPFYEKAAKTWGTGWYAKSKGCGSVWDSPTYDAKLHLVYMGVGGPGPWDPNERAKDAGDELFTNSVVAVDARTGKYVWHFKSVPQDAWNLDALGIMVADVPFQGKTRRVVLHVPKDGFVYMLDAHTGKFLAGNQIMPENWAKGLDANGRPIRVADSDYWRFGAKGVIAVPGPVGAHSWDAMAFSPGQNLLYVPTTSMPTMMVKDPNAAVGGMLMDYYAGSRPGAKWLAYSEVVAWDVLANKPRWRRREKMPLNSGLMHTAGGLVFQGTADGKFIAYDDVTGSTLWERQVNGAIRAAPSTVMQNGEQYVIVATGNGTTSATSFINKYSSTPITRAAPPRLLAFKIGGKAPYPAPGTPPQVAAPALPRQPAALAAVGEKAFQWHDCYSCHGANAIGTGGSVPNLSGAFRGDFATFRAVVKEGALSTNGMPQFATMSDAELRGLYAFIVNQAWRAYEEQSGTGRQAERLTPPQGSTHSP